MRTVGWCLLLLGLMGIASPAPAQPTSAAPAEWSRLPSPLDSTAAPPRPAAPSDRALHHVVGRTATLYNRSDSTAPVGALPARTPLYRLGCSGAWCRVRTDADRTGYVPAAAISNVWIRISKAERRLYLYRGPQLVDAYDIDIGYNTFADKTRRGSRKRRDHWRTPEGTFYVVDKNPRSQFYKALVLNYPTSADAERGLEQGLISRSEYNAIVRAQEQFRMPPMNTDLGGWIEIHGEGTGAATNWTQGCVAVKNRVMNQLWTRVAVGTPVLIE
ncbi:MAG: L,D-transpeptidase family protein [Salinibacter sp.]